jgi:hypothetical protein
LNIVMGYLLFCSSAAQGNWLHTHPSQYLGSPPTVQLQLHAAWNGSLHIHSAAQSVARHTWSSTESWWQARISLGEKNSPKHITISNKVVLFAVKSHMENLKSLPQTTSSKNALLVDHRDLKHGCAQNGHGADQACVECASCMREAAGQ